tara:strand:- start:740 stop:1873 length:1134 start_codon:yes stop_codon:yes gene_type:complete
MINSEKRIYLSPPTMKEDERKLLLQAFDSNWIAPLGPEVDMFEEEVSKYLKIPYSLALNSGTSALHLALKVLGVKRGDKVICPSLTFAASAFSILYQDAIPIFFDVGEKSWVAEPYLIEKTIKIHKPKALITVDLYGQSCNYELISKICKHYNVLIIEDAAEALGSRFQKKMVGSFGDIAIISFNGNKIITTSSGGMLLSKHKNFVEKARYLSNQAKENKNFYEHHELGYNYRLSNLLASIGRGQLKSIEEFVNIRRGIFEKYKNAISCYDGFDFLSEINGCVSNRWLTTLTVDEKKAGISRDDIINALAVENIESRPIWNPMHLQPFFKNQTYVMEGMKDNSKNIFECGVCLPSGSSLTNKDQDKIIDIIVSLINN